MLTLKYKLLLSYFFMISSSLYAQTDTTISRWNWNLSAVLGVVYQDHSFAERFISANLNDGISIPNTMFANSVSFGGGVKRLGIEVISTRCLSRPSSSLHDVQLLNQYNQICVSYLFGNFKHLGIKGLVGMTGQYLKLDIEKQVPVTGYNTLSTNCNTFMVNIGTDILWKSNPKKKIPIYTGFRIQYSRSLSNTGWSYAPIESTSIGTLDTILLGWVIGFGDRN